MMGVRRRRLGRFGISHGVASAVAIAILAVSPGIVSVVGSHIDDTGLAIAEAVFGGPACGQEAPGDRLKECLADARNRYQECRDFTPWYFEARCWVALKLRITACFLEL